MRSIEDSHEPSRENLATILVAIALAVSSCKSKTEDGSEQTHPYPAPSVDVGNTSSVSTPRDVEEIDYDHPLCSDVRAAKTELDTWNRADKIYAGTKRGMATPPTVMTEVRNRFLAATRAAGSFERAIAVCLERRHVLGGKQKK